MVQHLLEKWKADPTKPDRMGMNALHTASFWANDNMKNIDLLLEYEKVDINERDEIFGRTALHWAVRECNSIAVGHLIDKGADPNIFDEDGLSPLHLAASKGNGTEIMDFILKAKKAKQNDEGIDDVDHQFGTTALHMAVTASNLLTVEYLIEKGADINYRHKSGCTPFFLAAAFVQDQKIIDLLLKNIEKKDIDKFKMDASSLLRHITANENRLINRNIIRVGEKDIFHREECDRLADKPVYGKMESSKKEIFNEIVDTFLFDEIRRITYFLAAGVARLKYFKFADWDNFVIFIYRNEKKTKKS
jgi:ankyrin repeat protein